MAAFQPIQDVNIGNLRLTFGAEISYNKSMISNIISYVIRICLIASLWILVWKCIEPKTQLARILRAAVLVLGLLVVLALTRITGF